MNAVGDIEAKIAGYVLEVEKRIDQTKQTISKTFEGKQQDQEALISNLKSQYDQKASEIGDKLREINQLVFDKYQEGIDGLQSREIERNGEISASIEKVVTESQDSLLQGLKNIRQSMEATGQTLYQSIDERNEKVSSFITDVTTEVSELSKKASDASQHKIISSLDSYNEEIQQELGTSKQQSVSSLEITRDEVKSKTKSTSQNLHQAVNEILADTQNKLSEMLQQAQDALSQNIVAAKTQVENTINTFTGDINNQTDGDFQKIVTSSESTYSGLTQNALNLHEKSREELMSILSDLIAESTNKGEEFKGTSLLELNKVIDALKAEVTSHLDQFKEKLIPQEQFIKNELLKLQTEMNNSHIQSLDNFKSMMEEFKLSVNTRYQTINDLITQETNTMLEGINSFVGELKNQIEEYDKTFGGILAESASNNSHHLVAQTRELEEKLVSTINNMNKTSTDRISATSQLISSSIKAEIATLETELQDFTTKFKEVTQRNEDVFKNYLFSLEKISSLVTETEHPVVQTAPIVSKEATLTYIYGMFSRITSGIRLLMPNIQDIPVGLIMETKNHQRVELVTNIDPSKNTDLLKKLFSRPNVRVRRVDPTKFVGVEGYIAADRDGEEVLIGITEDQGETVAIASQSDAFVNLMGKIVLGDYFLARSQEINRSEVGM
ncbi:MAG: hypothetical protein ACXACR_05325 [Candidatus Hodarchaeales archaeon]|jgi:hypothetical protein